MRTFLDLFAGAGGFGLGLERAGFRCVGAVELNDVAAGTLARNLGPFPVERFGASEGDILRVRPSWVARRLEKAGISELDLLVAGPPCQGFSRVGRGRLDSLAGRVGAFLQDDRNALYRSAITFARVLRPKVVIIENVSGMLHHGGTNVAELVAQSLRSVGYNTVYTLLNAAAFGVPQSRERVFVIGTRDDLPIRPAVPRLRHSVSRNRGALSAESVDVSSFAEPGLFVRPRAHGPLLTPVTVREALGDLPSFTEHLNAVREGGLYRAHRNLFPTSPYAAGRPGSYARQMRMWPGFWSHEVSDHFCRWTPRDFPIFREMKQGDRYPEALVVAHRLHRRACLTARIQNRRPPPKREFVPPYPEDGFPDKWQKLREDAPSATVTAHLSKDTYSHIHFDSRQARTITPREAARLQSFPDGYVFSGNTGDMYRQIGNSVPPLLAAAIGETIKRQLERMARR